MKPAHRRGAYHADSTRLNAQANANPHTRCWKCNRTLAELPPHTTGRPAYWTTGHERPGDPTSPLHHECSHCACREGGLSGHARQQASQATPTRNWYRT